MVALLTPMHRRPRNYAEMNIFKIHNGFKYDKMSMTVSMLETVVSHVISLSSVIRLRPRNNCEKHF